MKYIASLSGGKDSVAMVLRLIDESWPLDEVIYYDNGMDFTAIYDVVYNQVNPVLQEHGVKLVTLHPKTEFLWDMFERPINGKNGPHNGYSWCGGVVRWGTKYKTRICDKYCLGSNQYIGIAYDEQSRIRNKIYPLVQWQMTEADCLQYCRDRGIHWTEHTKNGDIDLYDILDRVSCWCCCNKNLKELEAIYTYLPEYWEKLKWLQSKTDRPFKKYGTVFELEERFKKNKTN